VAAAPVAHARDACVAASALAQLLPPRIPPTSGSTGCCLLCVLFLPFILDTLYHMLVYIASVGILRHCCL
jgi:hypothetical protein